MRKACFILTCLAGGALFTGCSQQSPPAAGGTNSASAATNTAAAETESATTNILATDQDRESYAIGMYFASIVHKSGGSVDTDMVARGLKDSLAGRALLSDRDERSALMQYQNTLMANRQKMQQQEAEKNREAGAAFLAQIKSQPGVLTFPNGMPYKILKDGTGATPDSNDLVTVNYTVTDMEGTNIDSSAKLGHPVDLPVSPMIPGWTYGLQRMQVGSKWDLYVPSDLAYGPSGRPPRIGPNEVLVFEVELLGIKSRPAPPPVQPLTSDIIKVPSAEDMKNGAKIETIKASDLQRMEQASSNNAATNSGK